ncbi:hypothetical protein KO518_01335 [Aestuariibacter sp. A3R04]|nr:hypothetical protein [Aestuariibacter sp. A3R04]
MLHNRENKGTLSIKIIVAIRHFALGDKRVDFLLNVIIWGGAVIFFIFIVGFMAAVKLNKKDD